MQSRLLMFLSLAASDRSRRSDKLSIPEYKYGLEECDVPEVRRAALSEYRTFRRKCLEYIRGPIDNSVMNQVHDLAWHTAVFRTLNEARRLEPERLVNGTLWELAAAGYTNLMSIGMQKLVDRDHRADSLWNLVTQVESRHELLSREEFVCYDGLPFDYETASESEVRAMSEELHKAFDKLSGVSAAERRREDRIQPSVLAAVKEGLSHPAIERVCMLEIRRIAHADRLSESSGPIPTAIYDDIDQALRQIVKMANLFSMALFHDAPFGPVVPAPEFDVLEALDQPWITTVNIPALHEYWRKLSDSMDVWANVEIERLLPHAQ